MHSPIGPSDENKFNPDYWLREYAKDRLKPVNKEQEERFAMKAASLFLAFAILAVLYWLGG